MLEVPISTMFAPVSKMIDHPLPIPKHISAGPLGARLRGSSAAVPMFQCVKCLVSESKCIWSLKVKCRERLKVKSRPLES